SPAAARTAAPQVALLAGGAHARSARRLLYHRASFAFTCPRDVQCTDAPVAPGRKVPACRRRRQRPGAVRASPAQGAAQSRSALLPRRRAAVAAARDGGDRNL